MLLLFFIDYFFLNDRFSTLITFFDLLYVYSKNIYFQNQVHNKILRLEINKKKFQFLL